VNVLAFSADYNLIGLLDIERNLADLNKDLSQFHHNPAKPLYAVPRAHD
jgi:hypothetical protein